MNTYAYLYAVTRADCRMPALGPGVDPRFVVQTIRCGSLAALGSRVGLDRFDPKKLEAGTTDLPWLREMALRHDTIVCQAAGYGAILPMRLGVVFHSRESMLAKVARHESGAVEFLRYLGDRREWSVRVYLDEGRLRNQTPTDRLSPRGSGVGGGALPPQLKPLGQGAEYLAARRLENVRSHSLSANVQKVLLAVAESLQGLTDAWRTLRPLSHQLQERRQRMVWNAACLLAVRTKAHSKPSANVFAKTWPPRGLCWRPADRGRLTTSVQPSTPKKARQSRMSLYLLGISRAADIGDWSISRPKDVDSTHDPIRKHGPGYPLGALLSPALGISRLVNIPGPTGPAGSCRWLSAGELAAAVLPTAPPPAPQRHAALLAAIHRKADILPVRFGTTVPDAHFLADLLDRRQAAWLADLHRLAGAAEMGLRIELRTPHAPHEVGRATPRGA